MSKRDAIVDVVRAFIVQSFLAGERAEALATGTNLFEQGVMDSFGTLQLIAFLEEKFEICFEPAEIDLPNFMTIDAIASFLEAKLARANQPST